MMNRYLILFIFFMLIYSATFAQERNLQQNRLSDSIKKSPVENIFNEIESGIQSGRVLSISKFFSPQTYFSFLNGTSGYYSSNQAFYVLEDFFKIYPVTSFKLRNVNLDEKNPYATGVYNFEFKGKRDSAQVYISLKYTGNAWKITQITIN